jgi:cellobiose phosphorylase
LSKSSKSIKSGQAVGVSADELPLRSELFSADQMAQHGIALAKFHAIGSNRALDGIFEKGLLERLAENEKVLTDLCNLLIVAVQAGRRVTPASEWLLDNFYLIEEQVRTAKRHLPKGYSRELPRLLNGASRGLPRVYDLALAVISHGDGRIDAENLNGFISSYQSVTELKLGELWAIPIMLRLALIENLRRVAVRIRSYLIERDLAERWANEMIAVAANDPKSLILVIADMARSNPPVSSSFVAELSRRLSGQSAQLALGLTWLEQHLLESSCTIDQLVQVETQAQAADQLSVSNTIGSLRVLGAMDWRDFVENQSIVEKILSADTAGVYCKMDFATRDRYRHVVEKLAKSSQVAESKVAQIAIELSQSTQVNGSARKAHVGYYLVDEGVKALGELAGVRHSPVEAIGLILARWPLFFYLGAISFLSISLWAYLLYCELYAKEDLPYWLLLLLAAVALISSSQLAVTLVNWIAGQIAPSRPLAKLSFSKGIPVEASTIVVVPTLLVNKGNIENLVEGLEVRFLANRDENLYFALLTDFTDAAMQTLPQDEELLLWARKGIEELNAKHKSAGRDVFFLFHRDRKWNPHENTWMGFERKRGKLADFNSVLRGGNPDCFSLIVGAVADLRDVKYVITLDTDTQLPRDAAREIIGAMEHPLNCVAYDEALLRVSQGYGILQPRVGVCLPGTFLSRYADMHSSDPGIDPYTRAVSDVYQDVFAEGSFIGKGIYHLDAFEKVLKGRLPENRILSHDLLEGCYVRSGLLNDVLLYEEYPSSYGADVSRRRRWIRGDWQLLGWLLPTVPAWGLGAQVVREKSPLTALSRWKIFDNLRRSLVPLSLTAMLLASWLLLARPWLWTLGALAIIFLPPILFSLFHLLNKPKDVLVGDHLRAAQEATSRNLRQALFYLACLPYEAFYSTDAIVRTLFRMVVSHKHLLAWNPSGQLHSKQGKDLASQYGHMISAPLLALGAFSYLALLRIEVLPLALPILLGWFLAPVIAWWVSLPASERFSQFDVEQRQFLRKIARKTWSFFEMFVGPEDHWLPPDNFQELPLTVVAHRTSPTNIGLSLLANLTAHDFGYIQIGEVLERSRAALSTVHSLERYRGHLYNWYDTQTLRPLPPCYISTVDSGNLAGHLLTFNAGLLELADEKIIDVRVFSGMADTLALLGDALGARERPLAFGKFDNSLKRVLSLSFLTCLEMKQSLEELLSIAIEITCAVPDSGFCLISFDSTSSEASYWAAALKRQCDDAYNELVELAPWVSCQGEQELSALAQLLRSAKEAECAEANISPPSLELSSWQVTAVPALSAVADGYCQCQWALKLLRDSAGQSSELNDKSEPPEDGANFAFSVAPGRLEVVLNAMLQASGRAREKLRLIEQLVGQAADLANIEYEFLYDKGKQLLSIGYNVDERRLDSACYDLLASEARLCNFVAIAQGQLPQESWFALGRLLTAIAGEPVLFSWSGSMFEYLMPLLVMPTYANTLLYKTCQSAVARQIEYGRLRGVPWGISESGYYAVDAHLNYQYRAFGVPGLGLKRGLSQDLVVAPYATALALMVEPEAACANLQRLAQEGYLGKYGFWEAIDFTPARIPRGQNQAVVRSFMAHHQGMSFLSLAYALLEQPMQRRFNSNAEFQATTLLLQERIPRATAYHLPSGDASGLQPGEPEAELPVRIFNSADGAMPDVQLLSNGRYHVMVTTAGGGYSRWKELAVTRWREDSTCDNWGTFTYLQDVASGEYWSTSYQPTLKKPDHYEAIFSEARVEFRRRDCDFDTHTEIVVSSEDDIELRRVHITNRSRVRRTISVTTYGEVVLAIPAHDVQHPAFSNLFVQSEILNAKQAIICHRRPRSENEHVPWMFHLMAVHGAEHGQWSFESDRLKFIGRGNTVANPQALQSGEPLSGSDGSVLDPIVAISCQITLEPAQSCTVNIVTGITESRQGCLDLVEKYHDRLLADRVFDLAWTHSQVVLRQLNASECDGQLYARLANSIIYANANLRADAAVLMKNRRGQSGLWGYAISGDLPIVLLQIQDPNNIALVRQLVQAHAYWRQKGLLVDLVIWNEDRSGYRQLIQNQIMGLIASGAEANLLDKSGGIFVRTAAQLPPEDRLLFLSVARAIIKDSRGTLAEQVVRRALPVVKIPNFVVSRHHRPDFPVAGKVKREDLVLFNGLGGFTQDGREYVIVTSPDSLTPLPWVNVIANPHFGTVVSESGSGYTWLENAHEFRLTPWNNDPVTDSCGEAFYLRDEESGYFWSSSPLPSRGNTPYVTRHGFGYSVFEHNEGGINSEMLVYVAHDAPVKVVGLKIRNNSGRSRRLSATGYVEWLLGDIREKTAMHVTTEVDLKSGAILARNAYSETFPERIAFFDVDDMNRSFTGDRTEFLGRNGTLGNPAAMSRMRLSGKVGAGLDPCGAIQVSFDLADGQEREIVFRLGIGQDVEDVSNLISRFRGAMARRESYEKVCEYWKHTLGAVHVQTADPALNMIVNGWLLYQTIASRMWGRSGYYQSGGAYGFRDQLQDAMAVIHAEPLLLRKHLLLCASRQFQEGDVQHWWHPPSGRGVRTRISDDYLWLPLATSRYVAITGDTGVLDEQAAFLSGPMVNAQDDSYYDLPGKSSEVGSLYEHCKRAIVHGLRYGVHGIPLMGCGDWNDGMNLVGAEGRGESVWLGFFLLDVLQRFVSVAVLHGDETFAERCRLEAAQIRQNIEENCWDGNWYRRAYFDDGLPLGSASNDECQIDSISQSWAVLSGAAAPQRRQQAMDAVYAKLVCTKDKLVQLLHPPFDKSALNPGYIKGYVPGVRENGGQYTHAAVWTAMAFAAMKDGARAWELADMINPVNHAQTPEAVAVYKAEPYVVAADVYAVAPHIGRGGWSWYTGSAGWMYRLIIESLLGISLKVDKLSITPVLPADWGEYKVHYRYRETVYHITIVPSVIEKPSLVVDGALQAGLEISLVDDRREHEARLVVAIEVAESR